ncbi:MAG: DUF2905 domain-containing protein [Betaproteobacteria bacterium]|nr:DUF2905 domain-containing protein [Betaproteobacteria bacterium]
MIRWMIVTLLALILFSGLTPLLRRFGIGRLPGDLTVRVGRRELSLPIGSTIILSLIAAGLGRLL